MHYLLSEKEVAFLYFQKYQQETNYLPRIVKVGCQFIKNSISPHIISLFRKSKIHNPPIIQPSIYLMVFISW